MDYEHLFVVYFWVALKAIFGVRLKQNEVVVLKHLQLFDIFTVPILFPIRYNYIDLISYYYRGDISNTRNSSLSLHFTKVFL